MRVGLSQSVMGLLRRREREGRLERFGWVWGLEVEHEAVFVMTRLRAEVEDVIGNERGVDATKTRQVVLVVEKARTVASLSAVPARIEYVPAVPAHAETDAVVRRRLAGGAAEGQMVKSYSEQGLQVGAMVSVVYAGPGKVVVAARRLAGSGSAGRMDAHLRSRRDCCFP